MAKFQLCAVVSVIFFMGCCITTEAKETVDTISARRAFIELPSTYLDLLPRSTRLDLLDYYDAGVKGSVVNQKMGESEIDTVSPDYINVSITESSSLQLKVLKTNRGDDMVLAIYTTGGEDDCADSEIRIFDSHLRPLAVERYVKFPTLKDFFEIPRGRITTMKEIEEMVPFKTVAYRAYPDSDYVTARLTVSPSMSVEDARIIQIFEKPQITLRWNGKKLKY